MADHTEPSPVATRPEAQEAPKTSEPTKVDDVAEDFTLITTGSKTLSRRVKAIDDFEPLIDTTAALPKRSKKTERATKRLLRRQQKLATRRGPATLSDLPPELLEAILSYLRPSDVLTLARLNRSTLAFIRDNEPAIARAITRRRYAVLAQCFPLPQPLSAVPAPHRPALLCSSRQSMIQIHKRPYQHIPPIDPHKICTCMTCILAWNNLALLADLAHWQTHLSRREPIPMIPRGTHPAWNAALLATTASRVEAAMRRPLLYTLLLQHHLATTVATLLRTLRGQKTVHPRRVFHLSTPEAAGGLETDVFLEREGPENHEFPFHRDNYYNLNAYVPNRKWDRRVGEWRYYPPGAHERDVAWVVERFGPAEDEEGVKMEVEQAGNEAVRLGMDERVREQLSLHEKDDVGGRDEQH